jgi:hypothetical protein
MTLTQPHVEWLSLIRYQAITAVEQSRLPMPLAMLSINGFHDAVEAMLGLVAEHRQVAVKNKGDFAQLFDGVAVDVAPVLDHHRARLIALNNARVGFTTPRCVSSATASLGSCMAASRPEPSTTNRPRGATTTKTNKLPNA